MKVLLVTACGRSKEDRPLPAWRLYRSSRIRFLKRVATEVGVRYAILSAKYGLVDSDEVLEPYEMVMDRERCAQLLPSLIERLKDFGPDVVVFYKGGARREYAECMREACDLLGIPLTEVGYAYMGDIRKVKGILRELLQGG